MSMATDEWLNLSAVDKEKMVEDLKAKFVDAREFLNQASGAASDVAA